MDEDLDGATRIYAAMTLLDTKIPTPGYLAIGDIIRFVSGRTRSLTQEQTRYLFSRPDLRRAYQDYKREMTVFEMPAVAAASTSERAPRRFEGGELVLTNSSQPGQLNVSVTIDPEKRGQKLTLLLENPNGVFEQLQFTFEPNQEGKLREVLDTTDPRSARIIELLDNNDTKGWFIRYEPPGP